MTDLFDRLAERDPSVPLALAAIAREAGEKGRLDLPALGPSYRETVLAARAEAGESGAELSSDEVHENLTRSVLPRLADEGWIAPSGSDEWTSVQAVGPWWEMVLADRQRARAR
ncbi:MAG TPA: hypothetical protein VLD58_16705, partial [Gemmatimonadales bacterium]|nr:hypothetical protein [Gemmatimonadales bacterium]